MHADLYVACFIQFSCMDMAMCEESFTMKLISSTIDHDPIINYSLKIQEFGAAVVKHGDFLHEVDAN